MDRVVHFELPADDLGRARNFYHEAFGWEANEVPQMDYTILQTTLSDEQGNPQEAGAINGGMAQRADALINGPVITIAVESIDEALQKVEVNGGHTLSGKTQVGDMGWAAYFSDTEGNTIGLWQDAA